MSKKICRLCEKKKLFTSFYKKKGGAFGLDARCKICVSLYHKQHFQKNKSKILLKRKNYITKYRDLNKDRISEYNQKYYAKNKEQILKYKSSKFYRKHSREYEKNKRQNDILYRITGSLRSRLNQAIKNNKKHGTTKELIGCSIKFLKKYLSKLFQQGMNWENYGKGGWHIDHIIPCASFDLTDPKQQKNVFIILIYSHCGLLTISENLIRYYKSNASIVYSNGLSSIFFTKSNMVCAISLISS